jgi:spore maturation protein CgeB
MNGKKIAMMNIAVEVNDIILTEAKNGKPSIRVTCENNSVRTLHSLYDPEAEARSMVDTFNFNGKGILVVLGLGLGYHVAELSRCYPEARIIVIESSLEIYEIAMDCGLLLDRKHEVLKGLTYSQVISEISEIQMHLGFVPVTVFPLSSAVSAFPSFYNPILSSLKNTESVKLWDRLRYPKFQTETLTVLMIDSGYFILSEAEKALTSMDHKVVRVKIQKSDDGDKVVSAFIEAIVNFKPDFLLTVNHLGLDEEGRISDFLKSIKMPVASWYVDSPNLIVKAFDKNVSQYMALFMWDRSYINDMKSMGFESVEYLPLATDEKIFRPLKSKKHKKKLGGYLCDVSFVGNSMVEPVEEWMGKVNENVRPVVERVSTEFVRTGNIMEILRDDERKAINGLSAKEKMDFEAAVIWKATLHYRLGCIKELKNQRLRIYGDERWSSLLDSTVDFRRPLNYYKDLPLLYNACKINFNATSLQMKEAVNQRVFDVPSCGAFLLTDYQESLMDLFDPGSEVVTYKNKEEIPELVKYYLENQSDRDRIVERARSRVLNEHTYKHRLEKMIDIMKRKYS